MTSRRLLAVLAGLALAWGGALGSAQAATTGLSGTITVSDGSSIPGCVTVYDLEQTTVDGTCSDYSGFWELPGLPDGTYRVLVDPAVSGWGREFAYGAHSFASATDVTSPGVVNVELDPTYEVTGVVTDVDGVGVENVSITAFDEFGSLTAGTSSWTDGSWSMALPAGDFRFEFSGAPGTIWYKDAASLDSATPVSVTGATTVNQSFLGPASVTGLVVDRNGEPIEGACAQLTYAYEDTVYTGGTECRGALTDADGRYALVPEDYMYGLPMTVAAYDPQGRYAGQLAGNTRNLANALTYDVKPGASIEVSTITLIGGGSMTGRTVVADTLAPLSGICPSAMLGAGDQPWGVITTCSNANGRYTVKGLPAGNYKLLLSPEWGSGYKYTWYYWADTRAKALVVPVGYGQAVTLRRQGFVAPGTLSGQVLNAAGAPVEGISVDVSGTYPAFLGGCDSPMCATTDAEGRYSIRVPGGTYKPLAGDHRGRFAAAFSGNVGTSRLATPVTVSESAPATMDFRLVRGLTITGTFKTATPSWRMGRVFTASGDLVGEFSSTDPETEFASTRLLPGTYKLQLEGSGIWYEATLHAADALKIELTRSSPAHVTWNVDLPTGP